MKHPAVSLVILIVATAVGFGQIIENPAKPLARDAGRVLRPDAKFLYAFYGRDYLIEVVGLAAGRIVRRFTRTYPKVPHIEQEWESNFRKRFNSPKLEYEIDVNNLYPVGDRLWVETSTDDKVKGRLIDVFDGNGRFLDSFFLGPGRTLMAVHEDRVFCQEKNEDETITIVKYKIDPSRSPV